MARPRVPRLRRAAARAALAGGLACLVGAAWSGCARPSRPPAPDRAEDAPAGGAPRDGAAPEAPARAALDAAPPPPDARHADDGNDDPEPTAAAPVRALEPAGEGTFVSRGRAPLGLTRVCDLRPHAGALYLAHANDPLGTDGATITRYALDGRDRPFSVAFDWNRPGEPTKGGGAGQGFLRIRRLGGRLFVPDADPPYAGFGLVDHGTEGYVFVSDDAGRFAPSRAPGHRPPAAPRDGGAGAGVLPRAYHVLDVVRFAGRLYASTGSVPPEERAWKGPSPGALHVAGDDLARWTYAAHHPFPWDGGVTRFTFLVRFGGRLFAGLQDYDGRSPWDFVVFEAPPEGAALGRADGTPRRVTRGGAARTLRWQVIRGVLHWIAWDAQEGVVLRVSRDGEVFERVPLPSGAGAPTDVVEAGGARLVLAEGGLYRLGEAGAGAVLVAPAPTSKGRSRFAARDAFCAAPLAVVAGRLFAGAQDRGELFELATAPDGGT